MFKQVILLTCVVLVCGLVLASVTKAEDPSLVGWWKLDETSGTIATDSSGNGHHGTLLNGPAWVQGKFKGGLRFAGLGDYVETNNTENLANWTVSVWVTSPAAPSDEAPSGPVHREQNYQINWNHNDFSFRGAAALNVGGIWYPASFGYLGDNTWYHLAATYDGDVLKAYKNGELVNTNSGPSGSPSFEPSSLKFGRHALNPQYFRGTTDDVRIYRRALTRDEIAGIMAGGEEASSASNPDPADGSVLDVDAAAVLSWSAGGGATQHDVYFGLDKDAVEQASTRVPGVYRGRQTGATYYVSDALVMGQTYYWRIDEVDKTRVVHKGTVWSFTVADYLVVDNFESYDDLCNEIFFTWLDGAGHTGSSQCGKAPFGGNGTGSTVEKVTAPDATRTVVYSGVQSMQLTYDNLTRPYYSQTERTFSPAEDWTRFDVNMVTVYLRGDSANKPDTPYVELRDSAQHSKWISHTDPQVVTKSYWKRWDIPLSEFAAGGVNLTSIKKIVLGIGDRTGMKVGGKGKVYVDDIRLRKVGGTLRPVAYWEFEEGSGNKASDSAGLNDGTVVGATWVPGKVGGALRFDGFDDCVDCGSDGALNPAELTVALWVCPENVYVMAQSLVAKVGSGTYDVDYSLQIGMMGAVKGLFIAGDSNVVVSGAKNLVTGEWTHLAVTRDGSEMALYMDGGSRTSVGYTVQPDNGGYPLRIGGPRAYQGKIDDVRIYDQALTPEQIEQIAAGQM